MNNPLSTGMTNMVNKYENTSSTNKVTPVKTTSTSRKGSMKTPTKGIHAPIKRTVSALRGKIEGKHPVGKSGNKMGPQMNAKSTTKQPMKATNTTLGRIEKRFSKRSIFGE